VVCSFVKSLTETAFTRVAQKIMPHVFSNSKFLLKNYVNNTYSSDKVRLQTLFFSVSFHFYSLAPTRNKCVYALSVPFLVLLMYALSVPFLVLLMYALLVPFLVLLM
jgi:hypothetical protein